MNPARSLLLCTSMRAPGLRAIGVRLSADSMSPRSSGDVTISIFSQYGSTAGRESGECGHMGVSSIQSSSGSTTGPPADSEYAEMLKLKDFYLERPITEEYLLAPDLLERTVEEFRRTQPFIAILNRTVQYAYDEMM